MKSSVKRFKLLVGFITILCGITSTQRSEAIEIAFERDPRLPLVYINLALKTGSVSDPKGKSGITNFMGEMLLRGTKKRSNEQLNLDLDQIGAKLEVETRLESIILRGAVVSKHLPTFLNIVSEVVTEPSFPETEISKLKGELISTLRELLGSDGSLASRWFTRFLFQGHPYGNPILGTDKNLRSLTRKQIVDHYNQVVSDRLLVFVGTGDASNELISNWVNKIASVLAERTGSDQHGKELGQTAGQEAGQEGITEKPNSKKHLLLSTDLQNPKNPDKRRLLVVDKPDRTQTQINVGQVGISPTDSDYFPLYLGNHALGGSFSSILMSEIRVKRGWSYGAYSMFRLGLHPRSWHTNLFPAAKDSPAALELTLKLLKDAKDLGITDAQFEFAQKSLIHNAQFMFNTPKKRVENVLVEKTLDLPAGFFRDYAEQLDKVSKSDVNRALNRFLKPDQMTITVLGTASQLKDALSKVTGVPVAEIKVIPYTAEDL